MFRMYLITVIDVRKIAIAKVSITHFLLVTEDLNLQVQQFSLHLRGEFLTKRVIVSR